LAYSGESHKNQQRTEHTSTQFKGFHRNQNIFYQGAAVKSVLRNAACVIRCILVFAFSACVSSAAKAGPVVSFVPSTSSWQSGSVFNVDVLVAGVTDLYAYQFSVAYDPNVVSISDVAEGTALSSMDTTFFIPGAFDNVTGLLDHAANSLSGAIGGFSGSGVLATLSFVANTPGMSDLLLSDVLLLNSQLGEIAADVGSAAVRVFPAAASLPEPSSQFLVGVALAALVRLRLDRRAAQRSSMRSLWDEVELRRDHTLRTFRQVGADVSRRPATKGQAKPLKGVGSPHR
jgi:hypothetical protein